MRNLLILRVLSGVGLMNKKEMKRKKASKKINKDYVDKNGLYFWGKFFSWKELFSGKYPNFLKNKTKHQKLIMDSKETQKMTSLKTKVNINL